MYKINYQLQESQDQMMVPQADRSYWKRLKPTLGFWLCLIVILAGFTYYRATVNYIFAPHAYLKQSSVNIGTHQIFTTIYHKL